MCLPKSLGGLNFREVEGFNQALVAKQVWRLLINPLSLAARFMKSIYYRDGDILSAVQGNNSSYLWRSLLWGRDLLSKGIRFKVGNGENVSMFSNPWLPKEIHFKPDCINEEMARAKVSFFISPSGGWNLDLLRRAVREEDLEIIKRIPINLAREDKYM